MIELNIRFKKLFCLAADHVASETPELEILSVAATFGGNDLRESLHRAKAMTDAISRRTKLPDFINWGHQFDGNMRNFLLDTWKLASQQVNGSKQKENGASCFISRGLYAFVGHGSPIHHAASPNLPSDNMVKPMKD